MKKIIIMAVAILVWTIAILASDNISFTDNLAFSIVDITFIIAPLALCVIASSRGWLDDVDKLVNKWFE